MRAERLLEQMTPSLTSLMPLAALGREPSFSSDPKEAQNSLLRKVCGSPRSLCT